MRCSSTPAEVPVSAIAAFSASGVVHSAFGYLVAAAPGSVLCVPLAIAAGDLRGVVHGCPVPWQEVWAVLDAECVSPVPLDEATMAARFPGLACVAPRDWVMDFVSLGASLRPMFARLSHPSGLRFARVS